MNSAWSEDDWKDLMRTDPEKLVDFLWNQEIEEMLERGYDPVFEEQLRDWEQTSLEGDPSFDHDTDPYDEFHPWRAFGMSERAWEAMFP